jgi:hypothetical protein
LFQLCHFIYILLDQKPSCHYLLQTLTFLDLSVFVDETGGQNFNFFKHSTKSVCSVVIYIPPALTFKLCILPTDCVSGYLFLTMLTTNSAWLFSYATLTDWSL